MGHRLRDAKMTTAFARPSDPPLPHPGNRKRQLPLQSQLGRSSTQERRKGQPIDQSLIRKPYSEVAHFSVEKPAQFCAETNSWSVEQQIDTRQQRQALPSDLVEAKHVRACGPAHFGRWQHRLSRASVLGAAGAHPAPDGRGAALEGLPGRPAQRPTGPHQNAERRR